MKNTEEKTNNGFVDELDEHLANRRLVDYDPDLFFDREEKDAET